MSKLSPLEQAILNGDFDKIDELANSDFEDEDGEEGQEGSELDEGKKGEEGEGEQGTKKGETAEGDKPKDGEQQDAGTDKPKTEEPEAGESSSQEPTAAGAEVDASKIAFDEKGNAIIPPELLSVLSKDGRHSIPYDLLSKSRGYSKELEQQLEAAKKKLGEIQAKQGFSDRKAEVLAKQLKDAGIDPTKLPEEIEITDELISSLDEYGEVGNVIKALIARTGNQQPGNTSEQASAQKEEPAQANPRQAEYNDYLTNHTDFASVMNMDESSDEFQTLDLFFTQVKNAPAFKDKPLTEQLDEAMARYNKVYAPAEPQQRKEPEQQPEQQAPAGQQQSQAEAAIIAAKAQQELQAAQKQATPASPSEMGASGDHQKKAIERALEANGTDLLNVVGELDPKELEQLFDEL